MKRLALFILAAILGCIIGGICTPIFTVCFCGTPDKWSSQPFVWSHLIGGTAAIIAIYTAWSRIDRKFSNRPILYPAVSTITAAAIAVIAMYAVNLFFWPHLTFRQGIARDLRDLALPLIYCLDAWAFPGMPLTMLMTMFSCRGWRFFTLSGAALALYWIVTTNSSFSGGHPWGIDLADHPLDLNLRLSAMAMATSYFLKNFLIAAAGSLVYCALREQQFTLGRRQPT